jgi:hypothetical protein
MGKKTLSLLVGLLATVALLVVVADSVWLRVVLGVFVVERHRLAANDWLSSHGDSALRAGPSSPRPQRAALEGARARATPC